MISPIWQAAVTLFGAAFEGVAVVVVAAVVAATGSSGPRVSAARTRRTDAANDPTHRRRSTRRDRSSLRGLRTCDLASKL